MVFPPLAIHDAHMHRLHLKHFASHSVTKLPEMCRCSQCGKEVAQSLLRAHVSSGCPVRIAHRKLERVQLLLQAATPQPQPARGGPAARHRLPPMAALRTEVVQCLAFAAEVVCDDNADHETVHVRRKLLIDAEDFSTGFPDWRRRCLAAASHYSSSLLHTRTSEWSKGRSPTVAAPHRGHTPTVAAPHLLRAAARATTDALARMPPDAAAVQKLPPVSRGRSATPNEEDHRFVLELAKLVNRGSLSLDEASKAALSKKHSVLELVGGVAIASPRSGHYAFAVRPDLR